MEHGPQQFIDVMFSLKVPCQSSSCPIIRQEQQLNEGAFLLVKAASFGDSGLTIMLSQSRMRRWSPIQ